MPKNVEKMSTNYSPNFGLAKRTKKNIKYLIFHYTGMKSDKLALRKLTNFNSKVSCHYYIDKNGKLIILGYNRRICQEYADDRVRKVRQR